MNPKEKAIELYSLYYNRIEHTLSEEYSPHEKDVVKECVLVAVDEIEKAERNVLLKFNLINKDMIMHYWQLVKEEIEKL